MNANERMTVAQFFKRVGVGKAIAKQKAQIRIPKERKVTSIEAEWRVILLARHPGCEVRHEPFALNLMAGVRYTPDLVVMRGHEIVELWECKGPHIHASGGRSKAAFKQAAAEWPRLKFCFAQKRETGWCEEVIEPRK